MTPSGGYYYMAADIHDGKWHHVAVVVDEVDKSFRAGPPDLDLAERRGVEYACRRACTVALGSHRRGFIVAIPARPQPTAVFAQGRTSIAVPLFQHQPF